MSDEPDSLVLRYLHRFDERTERMAADIGELRAEVRSVRVQRAADMQHEIVQDSAIGRLQDRIDRVERRLDISEDPQ